MSKSNQLYRRCHVCGALNETGLSHVERCAACRKPLAQFQYFDDRDTPVVSDAHLRPVYADGECIPIHGLTVHWETLEDTER
jgi:hypothetical protein